MGESEKEPSDALNDAIDVLVKEILPENEKGRYVDIRVQIEKLSLVNIPFRIPDVVGYLHPDDPEQHSKTNNLINLLLASYILRYEGKGYQLNHSITHPIRKWLALQKQQPEYHKYLGQLNQVSMKLQEAYPSAQKWYQRMLPESFSGNNISIPPHHLRAGNTA